MDSIMQLKKKLQLKHKREQGLALARRAGLSAEQYNTGVVRSDDEVFRVGVASGRTPWGDHVSIETMLEEGHVWQVAVFSPAKARLIAHHLMMRADLIEQGDR